MVSIEGYYEDVEWYQSCRTEKKIIKMETSVPKSLWSFIILLLQGALGDTEYYVNYTKPICAFPGSTVTIPCTYKYPVHSTVRTVIWCQNHEICQGSTPFVYKSGQPKNVKYIYLGDFKNNCTLKIKGVSNADKKVHRFRFETSEDTFTGKSGVDIRVEMTKMKIANSIKNRRLKVGDNITLTCTAICSFHQLAIGWYHNDKLLAESSPSLLLSPLTVRDSGNYSCSLKTRLNQRAASTRSDPYILFVEEPKPPPPPRDQSNHIFIALGLGVLLATLIVVLAAFLIKRRRQAAIQNKEPKDSNRALPADPIYDNMQCSVQPPVAETEEVSYAAVQFKHKVSPSIGHKLQQDMADPVHDSVIYSTVTSRGQ